MHTARRKLNTLHIGRLLLPLVAFALLMAVTASPASAKNNGDDPGIRDTFRTDPAGAPLPQHTPKKDAIGGGWIQGIGADFQIAANGRSARDAGLNFAPKIAFIDTQVSEFDLNVTITRAATSSLTGVVFRYVDSNNYIAATHDSKRLELFKQVAGEKITLARRSFKSKLESGDLWSVEVRHDSIQVRINGKRKLKSNDSSFADATIAGLIQQPSQATSFNNFNVTSDAGQFVQPPEIEPTAPVVLDSFTAPDGTLLELHSETEVTSGGTWTEIIGNWEISSGAVTLATPDPARPSGDHITVIASEDAPLQEISADITWHGGFAGLAWNVVDNTRYSIVFWDGASIVVGRVQSGAFLERGRRLASWTPGQTRNLRIQLNDDHAFVFLDDSEPIMLAFGIEHPTILNAGLFDRFNTGNNFDNFTVRQSPAGVELPPFFPDPPIVTPPVGDLPEGAWLFDSFDAQNFMLLRHRTPDVDPSGQGWTDEDGFWMILQAQATDQSGVFGPAGFDRLAVIDSGVDQYKLKSNVKWDGGRAGVFFGGRSTGPDDAGRNGFIFFRSGDRLFVGQLIGGVYFGINSTDKFKWKSGASRTLQVEVEDGKARLNLNGKKIFDFSDPALESSTWTGLFQRGGSDERFDSFTVRLPEGS